MVRRLLRIVIAQLFNGGVTDGANGNEAIIRLLGSSPALSEFARSYIEKSRPLKLEEVVQTVRAATALERT